MFRWPGEGIWQGEKWFDQWDVVRGWLGSDEWNDRGTKGEVLKMERGIREQKAQSEPRKTKVVVSGVEEEVSK